MPPPVVKLVLDTHGAAKKSYCGQLQVFIFRRQKSQHSRNLTSAVDDALDDGHGVGDGAMG